MRSAFDEKQKIEAVNVGETIAAVTELGGLDRRVGGRGFKALQ